VKAMMDKDYFSQWLGIEVQEIRNGYCRLQMRIKSEMLNGFSIAHGGIAYSLADSALAFASNSKGRKSLSIETSISHIASLKEHDVIHATAEMETESGKLGNYKVHVMRGSANEIVAIFRGTVYKTKEDW
jgi:acyl-CoA thioesterase